MCEMLVFCVWFIEYPCDFDVKLMVILQFGYGSRGVRVC